MESGMANDSGLGRLSPCGQTGCVMGRICGQASCNQQRKKTLFLADNFQRVKSLFNHHYKYLERSKIAHVKNTLSMSIRVKDKEYKYMSTAKPDRLIGMCFDEIVLDERVKPTPEIELILQNIVGAEGEITMGKATDTSTEGPGALDVQVGGDHYKGCTIQPVEYIEANRLAFLEGCIVKRITRHNKPTGKGRQDIEKIMHECALILELRYDAEGD